MATKSKTKVAEVKEVTLDDIPDMEIPDAAPGNPFQRRTWVECISNKDYEQMLEEGNVYRIEEVDGDNETLHIICDDGRARFLPEELFKSIEHGPFREGDTVTLIGVETFKIIKTPNPDYVFNFPDYAGSHVQVMKGSDEDVVIRLRDSLFVQVPNMNVRFLKRATSSIKKNFFKQGDTIKCVKPHERLMTGMRYKVMKAEGDYVWIEELGPDKFKYYHFQKWDKPAHVQLKEKKFKARMKLADHISYYINRKFQSKPTIMELRNMMLDDKIISNDVTLVDIKKIYDRMFSWK